MEVMFREEIERFIDGFDGKYELLDYGFPNNDYLKNGFWLKLKTNFDIRISSFKVGAINFIINGRQVYVDRGCLDDIEIGLRMIR